MPHDHETTRPNHSQGRSVAHNSPAAGISAPAVPFQLLKEEHIIQKVGIPFFSTDGEQLDTDEPIKVKNHVTALLSAGNTGEVEKLVGHLETLNEGAVNLAQQIKEMLKDGQQPKLPAEDGPVLNALIKRNVVIAGETHGLEGVEEKEKQVWGKHSVQVVYEGGRIIDQYKGSIKPDPGALRILYFMEGFYESLIEYKAGSDKEKNDEAISLMTKAYNRCMQEHNNYTPKQIKAGLLYKGKPIMPYERLIAYKDIMYETLELLDKYEEKKETFFSLEEVIKPAKEMTGLLDDIKEMEGRSEGENGPIIRELRSEAMFKSLQHDLHPTNKTIYKVGNNHVLDIAARTNFEEIDWIFTEGDYLAELERQWQLQISQ